MEKLAKIFSKLSKGGKVMGKDATMNLADIGIKGKVFCLSMQRSGTSSVGDFLQQWGLKRAGHPLSSQQQWSRHWYDGNYERIFSDPVYEQHEVYEDDPFWFPDFYKYVYHRVPDSRFVLLYRDSDSWFKSMVRHSHGFSIGRTDIHAKIYRREDELRWLEKNIPDFKGSAPKAMVLYDKAPHYKAIYERHIAEIADFFRGPRANSLFMSKLSEPDTWPKMKEWLGLPEKEGVKMSSHAHKAKTEFTKANLLKTKTAG
jgi:hypothetical protein